MAEESPTASGSQLLTQVLAELEQAKTEALALVAQGSAEAVKRQFLGAKGKFKQMQKQLGKLSPEERPVFGQAFHAAQEEVQTAYESLASAGATPKTAAAVAGFDFLPALLPPLGAVHPVTQTMQEITDIFARMGFNLVRGPEVEDVYHNFVALNIPEDHPARDPHDNFYIDEQRLLRSQTSTMQIRVMEQQQPPIRIISLGRVYRPDEPDPTHLPMFHQVEGLLVDEWVTMADLKTVLSLFCKTYLGPEVKIRFRPSFFPFTEPSIEVDMSFGEKNDRWVELGGAGMVDPNVFAAVGYDPERYTGFAFGLGIERLVMRRHGLQDIRHLVQNDVRFLRQFA